MASIQEHIDSFLGNIEKGSEKLKSYTAQVNSRQAEIKNQLRLLDDFVKHVAVKLEGMEAGLREMVLESVHSVHYSRIRKSGSK